MTHWITDMNGNLIKVAGSYSLKEQEAFLLAHPIGSYYISEVSTSPAELYGGGWEELDAGKTIWTIPTTETGAGEIIEAGLPNITGEINSRGYPGYTGAITKASGAFTYNKAGSSLKTDNTQTGNTETPNDLTTFDANNGADVKGIYGNSNTVQPPAIKVYMWKRYQ